MYFLRAKSRGFHNKLVPEQKPMIDIVGRIFEGSLETGQPSMALGMFLVVTFVLLDGEIMNPFEGLGSENSFFVTAGFADLTHALEGL
ncbi:hypothetical protein PoB_001792000 [Plakobranchus ocellatus]|uniref:Uncharacterized protein n=1 Tax=Plakobranchus ocellatus TaxID=259542 RepID=A0AAV3Z7D0_9GAST|nr:hypothetical protein PoB_001792000 [Plakobranchus ocellatus]